MRDLSMPGLHRVAIWTGAITGTQGRRAGLLPDDGGHGRYPRGVRARLPLSVSNYNALLAHVASWGYVVASVNYPGSLWRRPPRRARGPLRAPPRSPAARRRRAAVRADATRDRDDGHSLGGNRGDHGGARGRRFDACLALDPVDDDNPRPRSHHRRDALDRAERMGELRRPLGLFGATSRCASLGQTCAPETSDYRAFASAATSVPVTVWPLRDFGCYDELRRPGCGLACVACSGGAAPSTAASPRSTLSVAFLERYARDDASMQTWFDGAGRASLPRRQHALERRRRCHLPACR